MRILMFIYEYPPVGGGGGRVAQDISRRLVQRGHQVLALTAHCAGLPLEENDQGVIVRRLPSWRKELFKAGFKTMLGFVLAGFWHGWKTVRAWKPDIIHVHFAVPTGAAAWAVSMLTGAPYVLTAHLGDVPGGVPEKTGGWFRWVQPFTPPIWKRAAKVVAVSQYTRSLAANVYPVEIDVIPNGVDLQELDPGEIRVNAPVRLVFAGRFMAQKNPLQVVRILSGLKDLPWTCSMLGDGPLKPEVEQLIAECGLQARFDLPGWVRPEEVIEMYRKSDILLMPSLSEGLPVTGVQAMAMGLALVVGRVGGFIELVQPGENGELFSPDDTAGFQQALRRMISDPQCLLAYRLASRQIARRFELADVVASYEAIYARFGLNHSSHS